MVGEIQLKLYTILFDRTTVGWNGPAFFMVDPDIEYDAFQTEKLNFHVESLSII